MFKNVMMVCVGNICRSPIAEVYLKHCHPELNVYSSGLGALVGKPADINSMSLMDVKDIDLSNHSAQQISSDLVSKADLILTMEKVHINAIQEHYPVSLGKVYLIGKWHDDQEIPDPYRKSMKDFEVSATMIESGIDAWREKLWTKE